MAEGAPITTRLILADASWLVAALALSLAAGWAGDQLRSAPLGLQYRPAAEVVIRSGNAESGAIQFIGIDELDDFLGRSDVVTVDARPREIFELGHIPGARSLSRENFDSDLSELEAVLRVPGQTIVVYCADVTCEDGAVVAKKLQERGFARLAVYAGGYDEWEALGRPVETSL